MKRASAFLVSLAFFLLCLMFIICFLFDWIRFLITPLIPHEKSFNYILPSGGSIRVLTNDLVKLKLPNRPYYFEALSYMGGYAKHLHAGEYHFSAGKRPLEILRQIAEGKVLWRKITFIEGTTFHQISESMESNPLIVHTLSGFPPIVIMMKLGIWKTALYPEGLFYPNTYYYTAGMSDQRILLQAYTLMQKKLTAEWKNRALNLPYHLSYQALIAASIIEKEARLSSERKEIAGVIKRRLEKNMLLQMDPTVIYALEKAGEIFHSPLRKTNLKIDSEYNTYLYKGLPPTPICMPSIASIHAALHPSNGNTLYFVARGDGTHQFSSTYSAHLTAVNNFTR